MRLAPLLLLLAAAAGAQDLYRYQGPDGEWIYTDRPPADRRDVEVRHLESGSAPRSVRVETRVVDRDVELFAVNDYHAPVELEIRFTELSGLSFVQRDQPRSHVIAARGEARLLALRMSGNTTPALAYEYQYLVGDPDARHRPERPYRVPYAVASDHPVSQAYPDAVTHTSEETQYAVDFAMPVGTDVVAARAGLVFEVEGGNWQSGTDRKKHIEQANYVSIVHDDGTYAIYAHLDWNAIRVRPGDRVQRGEPIARSGNTGFSTGPHLHFAVLKNAGMRIESIDPRFEGQGGVGVRAQSGRRLRAY